jgi:hypothetical protein
MNTEPIAIDNNSPDLGAMKDPDWYIGKTALLVIAPIDPKRRENGTIKVPVEIKDAAAKFRGRIDLLVKPVGGKGRMWVSEQRLESIK